MILKKPLRPFTVSQAHRLTREDAVWMETREPVDGVGKLDCMGVIVLEGNSETLAIHGPYSDPWIQSFKWVEYGRTWRLWPGKATQHERRENPWEVQDG